MAAPRQLDGCMHGAETDHESVNASDWHDTMESSTGSMGGESNESVVGMFAVVKGAGEDMCCGQVGANGSRFCAKVPSSCKWKNHKEKKDECSPRGEHRVRRVDS
jgi:hypothetical protein